MRKIEKELRRLTKIAFGKLSSKRRKVLVVGTKLASIHLILTHSNTVCIEQTSGNYHYEMQINGTIEASVIRAYNGMKMTSKVFIQNAEFALKAVNEFEDMTDKLEGRAR